MTKTEAMFILDHSVEIRIPTQCGDCKKALPEQVRVSLLDEAKRDFSSWFGGFEVTRKQGGYTFPDGTLAEEEVDVVESSCSEEALEEHIEDLAIFAVRVANELSQDSVALSIDGKMRFYDRTASIGKCLHAKKGTTPAIPSSVPKGREAKTVSEKLQALYAALDSFSSLDTAKYVFGELLSYDLTDELLPWRDWPKDLRERLSGAPQVFAYAKGFKIVYLHQSSEQLSRGTTRAVISRILRDNANVFYGLFVVSNKDASAWELVNARLVDGKANRLILRRILVGTGHGARIATERIQLVDLDGSEKISAQEIQALHDSAFDVEGISKEFYQKIAAWYFWAQKHKGVEYPRSVVTDADQSIFFIRMLTRLIFCWFMRAKGLIPEKLFDLKFIKENLNDSKKDEGAYYKAILQNLFFATLNREINDRSFRRKNDKGLDGNYGVTTLYRYADLMKNPEEMLALFKKVPFVNGGLFECLDDTSIKPEVRLDDFSENGKNILCIPDELFFGREREIDLSGTYGDKKHKKDSVAGLINILNHYQFTVEENTPLDQAVALDPELLGKVFENLLASYNEETKTTARKALGAFYTPREIVDHMVDESLLAYLKGKLPNISEDKLRGFLAYNDEPHGLSNDDVETLISAIDHLKALDPAVGSGAFPMGMLHKLVHILGKLDPRNEKWKARQLEKIEDVSLREDAERAFRDNPADYGRKLYLIQNCIYGVDIQPVAIQIAKMRFFISLIVDQKQTDDAERNYGILALPNLETNFVAANTLLGIDRPQQLSLRNPDIEKKEKELHRVRQDHFNAKTPKTKAKCREKDEKLRTEIAELLKHEGWGDTVARQLANWNPYDQNASSGFFDPEWMFGIIGGFDILIANPPYGADIDDFIKLFERLYPKTSKGFKDIYKYFFDCSLSKLTSNNGVLCFITPNTYFLQPRYGDLRKFLLEYNIVCLINLGEDVFDAVVPTAISMVKGNRYNAYNQIKFSDISDASKYPGAIELLNFKLTEQKMFLETPNNIFTENIRINKEGEEFLENVLDMKDGGFKYQRINVGLSQKGNNDLAERLFYAGKKRKQSDIKIMIGKDINQNGFILSPKEERFLVGNYESILRDNEIVYYNKELMRAPIKIIWRQTAPYFIGCVLKNDTMFGNTIQGGVIKDKFTKIISPYYLLGLLNSKLLRALYSNAVKETGRVFPQVKLEKLRPLPIKIIDKQAQQPVIAVVEKIIAKMDEEADVSKLMNQLDQMVYNLYALSKEEIDIIEGKVTYNACT